MLCRPCEGSAQLPITGHMQTSDEPRFIETSLFRLFSKTPIRSTPTRSGRNCQKHLQFRTCSSCLPPHVCAFARPGNLSRSAPLTLSEKMQVRGTNAVQMFWLYTTRPDEVIGEITRKMGRTLKRGLPFEQRELPRSQTVNPKNL